MDLINGLEYLLCCSANQQNNASKDGISGLTRVSKKLNGREQKIKNYCNYLEFFLVNGELLLLLSAERLHNASKDMKNY